MAGTIKGITIEIGGNTQPLNKALDGVNNKSKDLQSELKQVERLLKFDPTNTTLLAQKQELLTKAVGNTKDKLDVLKTAQKQVEDQFKNGDIGEEQFRALQREIVNTETNLKSLEKQAKQTGTGLSTSMSEAGNKVTSAGKKASIASAAIAVGVGAAANSAMESADSLMKLHDQTGLSIEALQELSFVGGQVGVDIDTIAGAQAKLTKSMSAAKDGTGTQADAFKQLGISVTDANGNLRDAKSVMTEAFGALGNVGNETERDALSMAIFGKSAMDLNPIIALGSDGLAEMEQQAHDTGAIMSDETVKSLDDAGDSMEAFNTTTMATIGESLTPLFNKLTDLMKWFSGLNSGVKSIIVTILLLIAAVGPLLTLIGTIITVSGVLAAAQWAAILPIMGIIAAIAAVIAIGVLLYQNWDTISAKATEIFSAMGEWIGQKLREIGGFFSDLWNGIISGISSAGDFIGGILNNIGDFFSGLFDKIGSIFGAIFDIMAAPFIQAKDFIGDMIDTIKGFFDFSWSLPHIDLPHFSISGDFDINPMDGDGISVPTIGVDWYKTGAIFSQPSVIGVGEAGPEAVLPIEKIDSIIASAMAKNGGGGQFTIYNYSVLDGQVVSQSINKINARTDRRQNK